MFAPQSGGQLKDAVDECTARPRASADSTADADTKNKTPKGMEMDVATANKQNPLSNMSCGPCKCIDGNPSKLSTAEFERYLKYELCPSWVVAPDSSSISRTFVARNFQSALDWVVAAGAVAEKQGHHPDLHITQYRQVMLYMQISIHILKTAYNNAFMNTVRVQKCVHTMYTESPHSIINPFK